MEKNPKKQGGCDFFNPEDPLFGEINQIDSLRKREVIKIDCRDYYNPDYKKGNQKKEDLK